MLGQIEAAGIEAVQQRRLHRAPPGLALVHASHGDLGAGFGLLVTLGDGIDQGLAGLVQRHAALDKTLGDGALDPQLAGGLVDAGGAAAFLGDGALGFRPRVGIGFRLRLSIDRGNRLLAGGGIHSRAMLWFHPGGDLRALFQHGSLFGIGIGIGTRPLLFEGQFGFRGFVAFHVILSFKG